MSRDRFKHGLVIGKFYPPHLGHEYLIRTAAAHSTVVTVVVLGSSVETLSIAQRVLWLRDSMADIRHVRIVGELDDVPVDYADENIWHEHVKIMRQAVTQANQDFGVQTEVDAVFSSELYGERLADYFNSQHVCLDQSRVLYPTSGTAVRADVVAQWHMLSPAVQAGLAMRVVILGAESSGTTTLSKDLAASLRDRSGIWARTQWVAEYGREYSANLLALARSTNPNATAFDIDWNSDDFVQVALEQCRREDQAARFGSPVLICDTDALATCVWYERYMGGANLTVNEIAANLVPRALYILTSEQGVPFEDDGLRDGEHLRPWMTERFRDVLNQQAVPWIEVNGTQEERLLKALDAIESQMGHHWTYSHPLLEANTKSE